MESVSSESDSETDFIVNRLWPQELETDELVSVRSPVASEPWAMEYTSRIKDLIQNALIKSGMMYFFTLSVLCIRSLEIPVIVVLTDTSENASAASETLKYITAH